MSIIVIRRFRPSDIKEIINLFRATVRTINIRHYSQEQVQVWAPDVIDEQRWLEKLQSHTTYVADFNNFLINMVTR